jgi:hypothetical protein
MRGILTLLPPRCGRRPRQASRVLPAPRDCREFTRLAFAGLGLVPPGVVLAWQRRRESRPRPAAGKVNGCGGVAGSLVGGFSRSGCPVAPGLSVNADVREGAGAVRLPL